METNEKTCYTPFSPVHPFDILKDELEARGISHKDFAESIGMAPSNFSRMLTTRGKLTSNMAMKLEASLGIPYKDWMGFQESFIRDSDAIRERAIEEMTERAQETELNKSVNLKELFKGLGLTLRPLPERLKAISPFMPIIAKPESVTIEGRFKKSELRQTDQRNLLTWIILALYNAEIAVKGKEYLNGNADKAAVEISEYAHKEEISKELVKHILEKYGIGYVHVPKLDKTPVDAFSLLSDNKPCVIVTYRLKSDSDKFVFDVLHELGHISLHLEKGVGRGFLKIDDGQENKIFEKEADKYASDKLIPPEKWNMLMNLSSNSLNPHVVSKRIGDKAKAMGLNPSIAVSRYKHEINQYNISAYRSPALS